MLRIRSTGMLKQASDIIVISAGVMFGVTFFVFAAAFIGWWRLLILITVILSILMIVAWLVWGVVSIITVLVDDLCWAMQDYLDDAQASDLGDLIPCMDTKTAVETMNMAREMSFNGIVEVNSFLEDFGAENPAQLYLCYQFVRMRLDDLCNSQNPYYGEEYSEFICKGYRNNELTGSDGLDTKDDNEVYAFPKASCPYPTHFYEVLIGNFANEPTADPPGVRNLRCRFNMYELNADGNRLESNGDYVIERVWCRPVLHEQADSRRCLRRRRGVGRHGAEHHRHPPPHRGHASVPACRGRVHQHGPPLQ